MDREEKLTEVARIIERVREKLGSDYIPMADVRMYNHLMGELFGGKLGEDPELEEAKR